MKVKNSPIGEVECPHKGCDQVCKVFKFRPRTEGRKTVFTDKHYAECPKHGRIGADGNPATTEYILENATIWGPTTPTGTAPAASGKNRAPATTPAQRSSPAQVSEPAKRSGWRTLLDLD